MPNRVPRTLWSDLRNVICLRWTNALTSNSRFAGQLTGTRILIIDANSVPRDTWLDADICIIGAGPAGISLAREFDARPFRVMLLEAGWLKLQLCGPGAL